MKYGSLVLFSTIKLPKSCHIIFKKKSKLMRGGISIKGNNNLADIGGNLYKSNISIMGNNNTVQINEEANIVDSKIVVVGNGNSVYLDNHVTIGHNCWLVLMGENHMISIGKDCMIADQVDIWASDSHPIYDVSSYEKKIINPSGDIIINDHVWLGKKSCILKNVTIEENSVVGMNSIVTNDIPKGSVVVGNPAKIVRRNVNWDRHHIRM